MRDHLTELSTLLVHCKLPMPSAVDMADRALLAEMGITLDPPPSAQESETPDSP